MNATSPKAPATTREGSCVNCTRPETYDDLVQCDHCYDWWHMSCAAVTKISTERPWTCRNCLPLSVASSSSSSSARAALRLQQLEEERAIQQREWEAEKRALDHEKKSIQQKYKLLEEQLMDMERDNGSNRSQMSHRPNMQYLSSRANTLAVTREAEGIVGETTAAHEESEIANQNVSHDYVSQVRYKSIDQPMIQRSQLCMERPDFQVTHDGNQQRCTGAIPKAIRDNREPIDNSHQRVTKINYASTNPELPSGTAPEMKEQSTQHNIVYDQDIMARPGSSNILPKDGEQGRSATIVSSSPRHRMNETRFASIANPVLNMSANTSNMALGFPAPGVAEHIISPSQLAARQVMPSDLPTFTGDPADWPIFISAFVNTTTACGYSNVENLSRLQRCLKGAAFNAVQSRLLLPQSVPQVINTLQLLFGRPELLINVLLEKVRSAPAPNAERLETLIEFGMIVQTLCDHLEAAGQESHLTNPQLLIELVEKLPVFVRMDWAKFMQSRSEVNLKTFGDFMNQIVISASKVTLYAGRFNRAEPVGSKQISESFNTHVDNPDDLCCICEDRKHPVRSCDSFKALSVENRWKTVQIYELCHSCLQAHSGSRCQTERECGINSCTSSHHPLLHSNRSQRTYETVAHNTESIGNHTHCSSDNSLLFRIVPVTLYGPKKAVKTFAFLDDGSHVTLIDESLADELEVDGERVPLSLTWTGNVTRTELGSKRIELQISGAGKGKRFSLDGVRTVKNLSLPKQTQRTDKLRYVKDLQIPEYKNAVPRILIGVNNLHLTIPLEVREGRIREPIAVKTRLGWCIYGGNDDRSATSINLHTRCSDDIHQSISDQEQGCSTWNSVSRNMIKDRKGSKCITAKVSELITEKKVVQKHTTTGNRMCIRDNNSFSKKEETCKTSPKVSVWRTCKENMKNTDHADASYVNDLPACINGKTGTDGQCYGGEYVAAGCTAFNWLPSQIKIVNE